jgi:hypothetical protein
VPGDQVTYGIRMQLNGAGFTENQLAEGNGESLSIYSDALVINELGHVVGVKNGNTIDAAARAVQPARRSPRRSRRLVREALLRRRSSIRCAVSRCRPIRALHRPERGHAPSAGRIIRQGRAPDDLLTAADDLHHQPDRQGEGNGDHRHSEDPPVSIGGGRMPTAAGATTIATLTDKYVMYLHPYQVTDMRTSTSTGQWLDHHQGRHAGRQRVTRNGSIRVPSASTTASSCASLRRHQRHLGRRRRRPHRQPRRAARRPGLHDRLRWPEGLARPYRWNEELFDHKRRMEVSAWTIHGLKKTRTTPWITERSWCRPTPWLTPKSDEEEDLP